MTGIHPVSSEKRGGLKLNLLEGNPMCDPSGHVLVAVREKIKEVEKWRRKLIAVRWVRFGNTPSSR